MSNTLAEFMSDDVVTVSSRMPLSEALQWLVESDATELCVVDQTGHFEGVVTDYELLKASLCGDWSERTVASLLSRAVVVLAPDVDIEQAVPLFRDGACSRAFVCRDGRLIGQLTRAIVLRHLSRRLGCEPCASRPLQLVTTDGRKETVERRSEPPRAPQFLSAAAGAAMSVMGGVCTILR